MFIYYNSFKGDMIKNILYVIGVLVTIVLYYLFYDYQNNKFIALDKQLSELTKN